MPHLSPFLSKNCQGEERVRVRDTSMDLLGREGRAQTLSEVVRIVMVRVIKISSNQFSSSPLGRGGR